MIMSIPNIPRQICHNCNSPMDYTEEYETTFKVKDKRFFVDRIHAHICPNCKEVVYDSSEAERIEAILNQNYFLAP